MIRLKIADIGLSKTFTTQNETTAAKTNVTNSKAKTYILPPACWYYKTTVLCRQLQRQVQFQFPVHQFNLLRLFLLAAERLAQRQFSQEFFSSPPQYHELLYNTYRDLRWFRLGLSDLEVNMRGERLTLSPRSFTFSIPSFSITSTNVSAPTRWQFFRHWA